MVDHILFILEKARRYIRTVVDFLTTNVSKPDEDDRVNLKRALKYLKGTRNMKLALTVDSMYMLRC